MTVELAACQVFVTESDYASEERFAALLARVGTKLDAARERSADGSFAHPCLAVFPEMIGAFLPLVGRSGVIRGATTTNGALARVALRSLPRLARAMLRGRTLSPKRGFLLSVAPDVHRVYLGAFSRFAREHRVWVVAGSALLPRNAHGDTARELEAAGGAVYNTSYAFAPDGTHVGVARKVNLVPTLEDGEGLGLTPGAASDLLPIETPFGRVGTLICYDGFREPHTDPRREPCFTPLVPHYDALGCAVLAQPAANPWPWEQRWIFAAPGETLLRREQWLSEGLYAQLGAGAWRSIRYAVNPQLLGKVLDNRFDGRSYLFACDGDGAHIVAQAARADASLDAEEVLVHVCDLHHSTSVAG